MKTLVLLLLLAGDFTTERVLVLKPKAVHEEGVTLSAKERVIYSIRCSAPLKFNIHFHEGADVTYVREESPVREVDATFEAKEKREYWFMWTNDSTEAVALYFKIRKE